MVLKKLLSSNTKDIKKSTKKTITSRKTKIVYEVNPKILEKYADVLVNYGLRSGKGVKKGDVIQIALHESAKPLLPFIQEKIIDAGAHYITRYLPHGTSRMRFEKGSDPQIKYFPKHMTEGRIQDITGTISIISEVDKEELAGIDPKKIMMSQHWVKDFRDKLNEKELEGKFSWTLALYGTPEMAKAIGMSFEEYWEEIVKACYLKDKNPVEKWKNIQKEVNGTIKKLNKLKIQKIHVEAKNTDLWITLGDDRQWLGGTGKNIPSFEVFTSPDYRYTNGHIQFSEKLYRYGNIIEDAYLEFKDGVVIKAIATRGQNVLREMIAVKNANRVGEFSLTDSRLSKITKFMGETLYDENVGGKYGNTHIAVGMAYKDAYIGKKKLKTDEDWESVGFNNSSVHTDIVSTSNRKVTAILKNGKEVVIYKNGKFTL